MAYNTNNPVGSTDPRDLYDNAGNLDNFVNGDAPFYPDRLGRQRLSYSGMEQDFANAQDGRDARFHSSQATHEQEFSDFLSASGYAWIGDYAAGLTFARRNQYTVRSGIQYRPSATAVLPFTTTGEWSVDQAKFDVMSQDEVLRQDLANPAKGASLVANTVLVVGSIKDLMATDIDPTRLVRVASYHDGTNLGGGGMRYWSASTPKSSHNGGTIIDPLKAFPGDWSSISQLIEWFSPSSTGAGCWVMENQGGIFYPTQFGAKGDGVTNDRFAYVACAEAAGDGATIWFTPTKSSYRMHHFFGYNRQRVVAYGARVDLFKLAPSAEIPVTPTVLASSGSYARYEGLWLNCLETNLPNVRCQIEDEVHAHWYKCRFEGFRDAAPPNMNNGWGAYLKRSANITIELCEFENNSQNDIAILEGCTNINIISATGSALNINVEPNSSVPRIRCLTIANSLISKLLVQENDVVSTSANCILVQSCDVKEFYYDGAGVEFVSSRIQSLHTQYDNLGRASCGALKLNGAVALGSNLVRDPKIGSVSLNQAGTAWKTYTTTLSPSNMFSRTKTSLGKCLRMNPNNLSGTNSVIDDLYKCPVTAGQHYIVMALSGANYPIGAGFIGQCLAIRWLDSGGALISSTTCIANRGGAGSVVAPHLQSALVQAPSGATAAQLLFGSTVGSATTASTDWYSLGLHQVLPGSEGGGMPDPYYEHQATPSNGPICGVGPIPTAASYCNYEVMDRLTTPSLIAGGYEAAICVAAGTPGTWKGVGLIQA